VEYNRMNVVTPVADFTPSSPGANAAGLHFSVVFVEPRKLIGECLVRSLREAGSTFEVRHVETFSAVAGDRPDLVLLSMDADRDGGIRVAVSRIAAIRSADPEVRIVVLGTGFGSDAIVQLVRSGASGCIPTSEGLQVVHHAIGLVLAGGLYVPADIVLSGSRVHGDHGRAGQGILAEFTPRQLAVIEGVRRGKSNKLIAYELNMCESTVKVHLRSIMKKLKARNRTEAVYRVAELSV
jgi:DNA-binding NarL/FixJ family response regulator